MYTLLGCDPPGSLFTPIARGAARPPLHDQPVSFLRARIDGRAPYFEWIDAARYACGNDRGTMTLVARGLMRAVWFGFDADRLLIRVDTEGGPARQRLAEVDRLRVGFIDPADSEVLVMQPAAARPVAYLNRPGCPTSNGDTVQVATGTILEMAVPFARLDRDAGRPDPLLCRAVPGGFQPRPGAARGRPRADDALPRFRANPLASVGCHR